MAKPEKDPDLLEWTVQDEFGSGKPLPELTEPAAPSAPRAGPWRWAWLGVLAGVIALLPWLYARWEWWQTRHELGQRVAAGAFDVDPPLGLLTPADGAAPALRDLVQIDASTLRAEIDQRYTTPDGRAVTFAVTRFYQRAGEAWQPAAPPAAYPGNVGVYTRPLLKIRYYTADAIVIEEQLIPYLEPLLEQACAAWQCSDGPPAELDFVTEPPARRARSLVTAEDPLIVALLKTSDVSSPRLGAPYQVGYPSDEAGAEIWRRVLAARALVQLAARAGTVDSRDSDMLRNAYFYALMARAGARLGIEKAETLTYTRSTPVESLTQLWQTDITRRSSLTLPQSTQIALAILNALLRDQAADVDAELLRGLRRGAAFPDEPTYWLVQALRAGGMSANDFYGRLQAITGRAAAPPPSSEIDFALLCEPGLQVFAGGQLQSLPPFEIAGAGALALDWSPDGRRLAISTFLQTTALDLETGDLFWLPVTDPAADYAFPALWMSDTQLAYNQFPVEVMQDRLRPEAFQIHYLDLNDRARVRPGPSGVIAFANYAVPAPDHSALAVLQLTTIAEFSPVGSWGLIQALDQTPTPIASGVYPPAWSPDSQRLILARQDEAGALSLSVWERASGTEAALWDSRAWGLTVGAEPARIDLDWSRDGRWIALAVASGNADNGWLMLIRPDGTGARLFSGQSTASAAFSRDGRWLAALAGSELRIYEVEDRRLAARRAGSWGWSDVFWSPRDDRLLAFRDGAAYMFADPLGEPELLARNCSGGAWRP